MRLPLLVSVVLHALAIALLLTIRAPEPARLRFAHATAMVSPYRATKHLTRKPNIPSRRPPRTVARTFRIPDRSPQPAPARLTLAIPDPPIIRSPDVRLPDSAAPSLDLPPPPLRRPVAVTGAFEATIPPNQAVPRTDIITGNFGDASTAMAGSHSRRAPQAAISAAAEILMKPRPAYTDEARRLRIEGEVLLEVLFGASGEARVIRRIQGLGHGLDESAIAAARAIQFRPAKRGESAVDSTAIVHFVFQLAY